MCIRDSSNRDWPHNNIEYWYSDNYDGKVRFIVNDLDATMLIHNDERLELFIPAQAERLERDKWVRVLVFMQKLLEAPQYRKYFNQRLNQLLRTSFAPDRTIQILREMESSLKNEMPAHIDRWHFPNSLNQWERAMDRLEEFLLRRPLYLINRSNALFGFPLDVYPNPTSHSIFVGFEAWETGEIEFEIYDYNGRMIKQMLREVSQDVQRIELNLQDLTPGIYLLKAFYKGLQAQQRIVKFSE